MASRTTSAERSDVNGTTFQFAVVGTEDMPIILLKGNLDFSADPAPLDVLRNRRVRTAATVSSIMPTTTFSALSTVAVPATDQDRSKNLLEQLGFTMKMDTELQSGFRWIDWSC